MPTAQGDEISEEPQGPWRSLHDIYESEFQHVWAFLHHLRVPDSDMDDLVQEVFVKFFGKFEDFDQSRSLRPWLLGIAYRVALEFWRSVKSGREMVTELRHTSKVANPPTSADEMVISLHGRQLIEEALEKLSLEQRAILVLHEFRGETIPAIAETLSVPLNTAYSRLRAARAAFMVAIRRIQGRHS